MNFKKIQINQDLPIALYEEAISSELQKGNNLILIGETGSGKTTQLPLIALKTLSEYQDLYKGRIGITEPRRIAATSVSKYIASYIGEDIGNSVGYKIRFSEFKSDKTVLLFMTDGILIREIQINPLLIGYSVIMVDEAHERNLNSDFLIGLLIDIQKKRLEQELVPLQIIVTSATLEKNKFIEFFNKNSVYKTSIIEIPGRQYKVYKFYEQNDVVDYTGKAAELVYKICTNRLKDLYGNLVKNIDTHKGDILIFMPGKAEIERTKENIKSMKNYQNLNIEILTLHGDLSIEEQNKIFIKTNKRKIIIATNVAETSITVPGVKFVIDTGLIKVMEFNPHTGINTLVTKLHALKGLEQRIGRAGRTEEGYYFALYTKQSLKDRPLYPTPEVLRVSLSNMILITKLIGINDIKNFKFIDKPEYSQIQKAIEELLYLDAIDKQGNITTKGITMATLPLEPKIANLILEANKHGCIDSISSIASFLELKPIFKNLTQEDCLKLALQKEFGEDILNKIQEENISVTSILKPAQLKKIKAISNEIYEDYQNKQNTLKNDSSDFLTFIKILSLWKKNNNSEEWANKHYLSIETLQEAYNIKQDLLDICKENDLLFYDITGEDFNKRLNLAILESFKFNILVRQRNKLYTNIITGDKNIKISQYSVLSNKKPKFLVASEIVVIEDINSTPKLSARFVHQIDQNFLEQHKKYLNLNFNLNKFDNKSNKSVKGKYNTKRKHKKKKKFLKKWSRYRKRF